MTQVLDFLFKWMPRIITFLSIVPVIEFLRSVKRKKPQYYKSLLGIFIVAYSVVIFTFIISFIYVKVPNIQNESYDSAKHRLDELELEYEVNNAEFLDYNERDYYVSIDDSFVDQYIHRGSTVLLNVCGVSSTLEQIQNISSLYNDQYNTNLKLLRLLDELLKNYSGHSSTSANEFTPTPIPNTGDPSLENTSQDTTDLTPYTADISISFTDIKYDDSFYLEYYSDNFPGQTLVIDNGPGIHGTFTYSRPLTQEERDNWGHTGRLYDSNGNLVGEPGNYPTFWSMPDGNFAVGFPVNFQHGRYTYEIVNFIGDQMVTASIEFEY